MGNMNERAAFLIAEEYFLRLQREAAREYAEKIQEAYTAAHIRYMELLEMK